MQLNSYEVQEQILYGYRKKTSFSVGNRLSLDEPGNYLWSQKWPIASIALKVNAFIKIHL